MACLTPVTIRIDTPTGPLNSAVYESGRNKIFAVRDSWIYQLNGSTGAKENEMRFAYPGLPGETYIAYDSSTDMLWATYWHTSIGGGVGEDSIKYLAEIDPDDLSVTLHNFTAGMSIPGGFTDWFHGPGPIVTVGGIGFIVFTVAASARWFQVARVDLSIPSVTHADPLIDSNTWGNIHHDGTSLLTCGNSNAGNDQAGYSPADLSSTVNIGNMPARFTYGITKDPTNGFAYMATATQFVVRGQITGGAPTASEIDLGRANANPHNIRYNANDLMIYVPLYKDDAIAVIDPTDDSFEIKTGFTSPFDVVFTPAKKFALQHATIGLKEIT